MRFLNWILLILVFALEFGLTAQPFVYEKEISSYTLNDPQFGLVSNLAVDRDSTIYFTERSSNTVVKLDKNGNYLFHFGGTGDEEGRMNLVGRIKISEGFIYVASLGYINKFDAKGNFMFRFGGLGAADHQFVAVPEFDIDYKGDFYVGEYDSPFLKIFDQEGNYESKYDLTVELSPYMVSLAVDSNYLYVSDRLNQKLFKYDKENGQNPVAISSIYVPGEIFINSDHRFLFIIQNIIGNAFQVLKFSIPDGAYLGPYSLGSVVGRSSNALYDIHVNHDNTFLFTDYNSHCLYGYDHVLGEIKSQWCGGNGNNSNQFRFPKVIVPIKDGESQLVLESQNNRVKLLSNTDNKVIGGYGPFDQGFINPIDACADVEENFYVLDQGNFRVKKFSSTGEFLYSFGAKGFGPGKFSEPISIAITSDNVVLIAEKNQNRIDAYSTTGTFIKTFGQAGNGSLQFSQIQQVRTDLQYIYVLEENRIVVMDFNGTLVREISLNGLVGKASACWIGEDIYISDALNHRVVKLSLEGGWIESFGRSGCFEKEMYQPQGIYVDGNKRIYLCDAGNNRIQIWKDEMKSVTPTFFPGGNVFPNPCTETVFISPDESIMNDFEITIHSFAGQEMLRLNPDLLEISNVYPIELSGWRSGIYYVTLTNNQNKSFRYKLIKVAE